MRNVRPTTAYFLVMNQAEPYARRMGHACAYAMVHLPPNSIAPQWTGIAATRNRAHGVSEQLIRVHPRRRASTNVKEASFRCASVGRESISIAPVWDFRASSLSAKKVGIAVDVVVNDSMLFGFRHDAVSSYS